MRTMKKCVPPRARPVKSLVAAFVRVRASVYVELQIIVKDVANVGREGANRAGDCVAAPTTASDAWSPTFRSSARPRRPNRR